MTVFIKKLLFPLTLLLISQATFGQYKIVNSKNPIINKIIQPYLKRSVSLSEIDGIVRDLSQSGLFQVVYAEKVENNNVIIRGQETTTIKKISVQGNTSFDEIQILNRMKLKLNSKASELEIRLAVSAIEDLYREAGFYNFNINYQKTKMNGGIHLIVGISEQLSCIIEDIRIYSKNKNLNKALQTNLKPFLNTKYKKQSNSDIIKAVEKYFLVQRYLTAKVSDTASVFNEGNTKVKMSLSISNPLQFEMIFSGNSFFSHFDLIKQSKVAGKFLYLSDSSSEIVENIINFYKNSGFPEVKVKFREKFFADQQKKVLVFEINEGRRIKIGTIDVIGKLSRGRKHYQEILYEKLALQDHTVHFVRKELDAAAGKMILDLKREGYLQAELLGIEVNFNKKGYAKINLQIDEGILTYIRQILFRGAKSFDNIELKEVTEIKPNKPLQMDYIETSFEKLEVFYKNKGFLEFEIKNKDASVIKYRSGQPYADIVYLLKEGPKIQVNKIITSGNKKTKSYVLMRELDFKAGDTLTLDKVKDSVDRLEKSGLFSKVNIQSLEKESKKVKRDILIDVEDRQPGLFVAGAGLLHEGNLTYRGYLGILYNNLGGKARGISTRVDLKYQEDRNINYLENRIALAYYEPFLSKKRLRGRFSLVREQKVFDIKRQQSTNPNSTDILSINEFLFSTEKEFNKHFRFTYNVWGLSNQTTFPTQDKDNTSTINIATTGPVLELDYRNDPFLPTSGTHTRFEFEYSDPIFGSNKDKAGSDNFNIEKNKEVHFFKTSFASTFYTPLTKNQRWVWANSIRGGFLKNISNRNISGVPYVKSFVLGGNSTVRGFSLGASESIPGKRELCIRQGLIKKEGSSNTEPLSTDTDDCNLSDVYVRNKSSYFLIKSELRFPISGNFGGHFFYDGAAVYFGNFNLKDPYRDTVGVGIRYETPVGSFILEVGHKLDRKLGGLNTFYDKEDPIAYHLAIRAGL